MKRSAFLGGAAALLAAIVLADLAPALAQDYPNKPINLWIGSRAGGSVDAMTRVLVKSIEKEWGQPIVISPKAGGGGGGVCAAQLKRERPDGYTLCMIINHNVTYQLESEKVDYAFEDFRYVARLADFAFAVLAKKDAPFTTWREASAHAKKKGHLTVGTIAAVQKLVIEQIGKKDGIEVRTVPFQGGAEMIAAIIGGHIDIGFSGGAFFPHFQAGEVKVVAVAGDRRFRAIPDAPTLIELGYPYAIDAFNLLVLPAGTPDAIVAKWDAALAKAIKEPEYIDIVENKLRMGNSYSTSKEVGPALAKERESFKELLKTTKGS